MKRVMVFVLFVLFATVIFAKRMAPEPVPPVMNDKYIVTAPNACHWRWDKNTKEEFRPDCCFMGGIHVYDRKTKELLWRTRVYEVKINYCVEPDVQEVYITNMALKGDVLTVTNEEEFIYEVDLKNRKIKAIKGSMTVKGRFAEESDRCEHPMRPEITEQGTACDQEAVKKIK